MKRIPLNAIQYRFWMDNLLKYPTAEYNETNYVFHIQGALNIPVLKESCRLIMLEYPPFHSTIQVEDGIPYFVLDQTIQTVPFHVLDREDIATEEEAGMVLKTLAYQPFDLQKEYPCRFFVVRTGNGCFLLTLFHHVVMDGPGLQPFFSRLAQIYRELLSDTYQAVDQELAMLQYNAKLEKAFLQSGEAAVSYWKEYLRGASLSLPVPKENRGLQEHMEGEGLFYTFNLGTDLHSASRQFCTQQKTSPFRLYSTVWALTLSRIMQVEEVWLDHAVSMRGKEDESLFGVFINNLPIKYEFADGESAFNAWIAYANTNRHAEQAHLCATYNDILPSQQDGAGDKRTTINVAINYPLHLKKLHLDLDGCVARNFMHVKVASSLDLMLYIEENEDFSCEIHYHPGIPLTLVQSLSTAFGEILRQVVACLAMKLKDVRLLSEAQEHRLLIYEDQALRKALDEPVTFLSYFRQKVSLFPNHPAVAFGEERLTYAELDQWSNRVAMGLRSRNLSHCYIGLSTPKNIAMIVGVMGILKSGNVYVPIDYAYPEERIHFILKDCQISMVLVSKDTGIDFAPSATCLIEDLWGSEVADADADVPVILPSDEAYVIYTSGTTGVPKGIPITHAMLGQTVDTSIRVLQLDEHSRALQFANICFDASIMEIFPALAAGATLVLSEEAVRKDPELLVYFLADQQITSIFLPPAFLAAMPHVDLPRLATIFVGGDTCTEDAVRFWSKDRLFVNVYGPTENCVDVTHALFSPGTPVNDIGTNVPGVTCYVLDKYMHLMPDYAMGELYIGGVKLTEGYLHRPELNAEKFVANPFASDEDRKNGLNLRLYKTGDLVMRRADGHLLFMGRTDFQVKLNGYRIELGDIESTLREFGHGINAAVVIVQELEKRKRLVAYVQVAEADGFPTEDLHRFLQAHLPAYMVPAVIVPMDAFPYNTSGKVDRKKLPAPTVVGPAREVESPATETEQQLAALWKDVLGNLAIGRDDSFISLGGDSMAVIQLTFRISEHFAYSIKASEIYQHITLRDLARFLDGQTAVQDVEAGQAPMQTTEEVAGQPVPLPPAQLSLWMECMKSDDVKNLYNLPCFFELPVSATPAGFQEVLNQFVRVQDGFRLCFPLGEDGEPYIYVNDFSPFEIEVEDIADRDLSARLAEDMAVSFDLAHAPLFRCVLYRVDGRRLVCSLVMHHLISDGWSSQLVQKILTQAVSGDKLTDWNGLGGSYVGYAREIGRFVQTEAYARRLDYWKTALTGVTELSLPRQKQDEMTETSGSVYTCPLPQELTEKVSRFCFDHGYTPFLYYASVYLWVLSRLSRQTGFAIGFPFLGRERAQDRQTVGFFVHTLPLLYKPEYDALTFEQYIKAMFSQLLQAEENAVSLQKLTELSRMLTGDHDLSLLKTIFTFEEKMMYHDYLKQESLPFDLSLIVLAGDGGQMQCVLEYRHSCLTADGARRFVSAFMAVLEGVTENADRVLTAYPLATAAYRNQVIADNELSVRLEPNPQDFLDCFAAVVSAHPQQIAIVYQDQSVTYQELDRLSDDVAVAIRAAAVVPPASIAVHMVASTACVATMIGILKSGCCYVPISVDFPPERRDFILQDAACRMIFNESNFPAGSLLTDGATDARFKDCAYVIYTSGTTGYPKGVPILRQSLAYLIREIHHWMQLDVHSRGLLYASVSFDSSVEETFSTLSAGGTLVIATQVQRKDPELLADLLEQQAVSYADIPPAMLPLLPRREYPALATVEVGGESTAWSALEHWRSGRRLLNVYGPTEVTVCATLSRVDEAFEPNDIGIPLSGVSAYVLDDHLNIVPPDMPGELYLGGVQLTQGYLNRPDLNREKFVDNPYVTSADKALGLNTRLYKTGDLVRRRAADGHLIFLGRVDHQVKLYGYRIELEDIEAQIVQFGDSVKNAAVLLQGEDADRYLVAYVQTSSEVDSLQEALKAYLHSRLPAYMVPSIYVFMKDFPYNVSGKIDRKRLPRPEASVGRREVEVSTTPTEQRLAAIWTALLHEPHIGRTDSFTSLGGDSMAIIQLSFRIHEEFGMQIRVSDLYQHLVFSDLAAFLDSQSAAAPEGGKTDDRHREMIPVVGSVPLAPTQFSLWLQCVQSSEMRDAYVLPCVFECPSGMELQVFEGAFNLLVKVQDAFRLSFPLGDEGKPCLKVADYVPFPIEVQDVAADALSDCLNRDLREPFDLERGPLFRIRLYRVKNRGYVCALMMHHLIADGWSAQVIRQVLTQAVSSQPVDWDKVAGSYLHYAAEANRFLNTEAYASRVAHWQEYLSGVAELEYPQPRQLADGIAGSQYRCLIPAELRDAVAAFSRKQGTSAFVCYCAAYMLLLARLSRQTDFTIGIPFHGREQKDYSQVVGYFVHTLPLRYKGEFGHYSFAHYVEALQRDMVANEECAIALDKIMEVSRSRYTDTPLQLVRTMFTMEEADDLSGDLSTGKADFDLLLAVRPAADGQWACEFHYRTGRFATGEVERLATAFLSLLTGAMEQPGKLLDACSLASADYCRAVVDANVLGPHLGDAPAPFLDLFAQAVRRNPQHTAAVFKEESVSYEELDRLSDVVAASVRSAGVTVPACLAVCMSGSIRSLAAIIGILKAGCCYVPIDVELPAERKDFILKDARCPMFFDEDNFPQGSLIEGALSDESKEEFRDCAYVIYTSGTTGHPKGVLIGHDSLSFFIRTGQAIHEVSASSRVLLLASISFDASVCEIFPTLAAGATLVIASQEERKDPLLLADLLERQAVTCTLIPPAVLPLLPHRAYPAFSHMLVGGESTPFAVLKDWSRDRTLIHAYGPTENTVYVSTCLVDDAFEANDIGLPLPGVSCYVLDEHMNIVPPDMPGELYIGGVQLAKGYLNRPELTAAKFVDNPYVSAADQTAGLNLRLYRSGDCVKRRPDGHLIFIGRMDNQVKLRGFRVELSDIEMQLQHSPAVQRALVQVCRHNGQDELVAFVQPVPGETVDVAALQRELRRQLPPYMLPSKWAIVHQFPLTSNGKIDHRNLPEPDIVCAEQVQEASTAEEKLLLDKVRHILGTTQVGVETDLLDAGMTSMQIVEFVYQVLEETDLRLTISAVYKNRTLRRLLRDVSGSLHFWMEGHDKGKPVLVFMCGFADASPFYDEILRFLARDFSVLVMESYCNTFAGKDDISLNALFQAYESVLQDIPVALLTGYCSGAELAIAFARYMEQRHPEAEPYKVLNLEAVYRRPPFEMVQPVTDAAQTERFRILCQLYDGFPPIDYAHIVANVMARKPTNLMNPEGEEVTDEKLLERMHALFVENLQEWQRHYPDTPYYELDCDHWTFFEEPVLQTIRQIIRRHMGI